MDFASEAWFFGEVDRVGAEEILRFADPGVFLIRKSSKEGSYALSLVNKRHEIEHQLIYSNADGFSTHKGLSHSTMQSLLIHLGLLPSPSSQTVTTVREDPHSQPKPDDPKNDNQKNDNPSNHHQNNHSPSKHHQQASRPKSPFRDASPHKREAILPSLKESPKTSRTSHVEQQDDPQSFLQHYGPQSGSPSEFLSKFRKSASPKNSVEEGFLMLDCQEKFLQGFGDQDEDPNLIQIQKEILEQEERLKKERERKLQEEKEFRARQHLQEEADLELRRNLPFLHPEAVHMHNKTFEKNLLFPFFIPKEIFFLILSYLDAKDLARCSTLNWNWNQICALNLLWRPLAESAFAKFFARRQSKIQALHPLEPLTEESPQLLVEKIVVQLTPPFPITSSIDFENPNIFWKHLYRKMAEFLIHKDRAQVRYGPCCKSYESNCVLCSRLLPRNTSWISQPSVAYKCDICASKAFLSKLVFNCDRCRRIWSVSKQIIARKCASCQRVQPFQCANGCIFRCKSWD